MQTAPTSEQKQNQQKEPLKIQAIETETSSRCQREDEAAQETSAGGGRRKLLGWDSRSPSRSSGDPLCSLLMLQVQKLKKGNKMRVFSEATVELSAGIKTREFGEKRDPKTT